MVSPPEVTRALAVSAAAHGTTHPHTRFSVQMLILTLCFMCQECRCSSTPVVNRVEVEEGPRHGCRDRPRIPSSVNTSSTVLDRSGSVFIRLDGCILQCYC